MSTVSTILSELVQAAKEGKQLEYQHHESDPTIWNPVDKGFMLSQNSFRHYRFRVKPEPTKQPLTQDNIHPGHSIITWKGSGEHYTIFKTTRDGIYYLEVVGNSQVNARFVSFLDLTTTESVRISNDGGKTWQYPYQTI